MTFVKQTISEQGNGNCLAACIASLIGIDINEIPSLGVNNEDDWRDVVNSVLEKYGYYILSVSFSKNHQHHIKGTVIAGVPSLNYKDQMHAVLWRDGVVIHDPTNCDKSYLGQKIIAKEVYLLLPIFPLRNNNDK